MAEPLYDPEVDAWLDSLVDTDPDLLSRIEDQIDLLREEPIAAAARRRQFRSADGGYCHVITFEVNLRPWVLVWAMTPSDEAVVIGIQPTESL